MADTIALPSFRDGEEFAVDELRFGAMKRVYAGGMDDNFALLDRMVTETIKAAFPTATIKEIDNITMSDMKALADEIAEKNSAVAKDFIAPKTTK